MLTGGRLRFRGMMPAIEETETATPTAVPLDARQGTALLTVSVQQFVAFEATILFRSSLSPRQKVGRKTRAAPHARARGLRDGRGRGWNLTCGRLQCERSHGWCVFPDATNTTLLTASRVHPAATISQVFGRQGEEVITELTQTNI